jgi:beta-galactosidase
MHLFRFVGRFGCSLSLALAVAALPRLAAGVYELDLSGPPKEIRRGHLDLGGTGPGGRSLAVNSFYLERDGQPFVPVVGEFHFSRSPAAEWEESLRKMKAGGINVVASYVFWNLHEREQGKFDWSGDLDVRRFVTLAARVGLDVILRVGPFGHGEIRNGGLPDWIYGQPFEVRSNDPHYLALVDQLYAEIGRQVTGLFFKDGGPIIAVQLENEFQHSAAPWDIRYAGSPITWTVAERDVGVTHEGVSTSSVENLHATEGERHMATLKQLAKKNGLDAPLYTATGWGNAAIVKRGSLPVNAAYPYPFWTKVPTPSPFYLFTDLTKTPDYPPASYEPELYPSIPAELGAGIPPTYRRRSYVPEESVAPMIVRVLGSGSNGVGYYMYHGGATPAFDNVFFNEDAGGLPKINYDYQAPLGQYGRAKAHYFELRPLHLFLESYGATLAPLPSVLPANSAARKPTDVATLRYAARAAGGAGFVFLLNYQDHVEVADLTGLRLRLATGRGSVAIPREGDFTLRRGAYAILPVNLDLAGATLRSATVQPLTILRRPDATHHVFFSIDGLPPELVFAPTEITALANCTVTRDGDATVVRGRPGEFFSFEVAGQPVLVVPPAWAPQAVVLPGARLAFTPATAWPEDAALALLAAGTEPVDVSFYPAANLSGVQGAKAESQPAPHAGLSTYRLAPPATTFTAEWRQLTRSRFVARLPRDLGGLHNVFMRVPYVGDTGMAFIEGRLVDDDFYFGRTWEIGLKRFLPRLAGGEMVFVFQPMMADATCLPDIPPALRPPFAPGEKQHLTVGTPEFVPEHRVVLTLE